MALLTVPSTHVSLGAYGFAAEVRVSEKKESKESLTLLRLLQLVALALLLAFLLLWLVAMLNGCSSEPDTVVVYLQPDSGPEEDAGPSNTGGASAIQGSGGMQPAPSTGGTNTGGMPAAGGGSGGTVGTGGSGSCTTHVWCLDVDRDEFIDPVTCQSSCESPSPTYRRKDLAAGEDCYDDNRVARPDLDPVLYFVGDRGDGSFDYDCDGVPELELQQVSSCAPSSPPPGWSSALPQCGAEAQYLTVGFLFPDDMYKCTGEVRRAACR